MFFASSKPATEESQSDFLFEFLTQKEVDR
jgi:hypothetical protein